MRIFGRSDEPPQVVNVTLEEWTALQRDVGKLSAQCESLELKWQSYRDELKRLVNRLEQRDRRARLKQEASEELPEGAGPSGAPDPVSQRIMARRGKVHALPRNGPQQSG